MQCKYFAQYVCIILSVTSMMAKNCDLLSFAQNLGPTVSVCRSRTVTGTFYRTSMTHIYEVNTHAPIIMRDTVIRIRSE